MRSLLIALVLGVVAPLVAPGVSTAAVAAPTVEVIDLADDLSAADEQFLRERTPEVQLPPEITAVTYLLFPTNDDNLNDTVHHFGRDERRELLSAEGDKFAPGALIVAVGLDPRRMGVYCGDDVCDATDMYARGRLDGILDRMETPLRNGNWAAGMLEGTKAAGDPTAVREDSGDERAGLIGILVAVVSATVGLGVGAWAWRSTRRTQAARAREQFAEVQRDYGRVAQELQAIDVRAHSLTSPLADDELRRQWEEVKSGFLGLDETFDRLEGLTAQSADAEFRGRRQAIATAHEQVTRMRTAEENIGSLARLEHGDTDVRRRELTALHEDVLAAVAATDDEGLRQRFELLDARVLELRARPDHPHFMDEYVNLLSGQRVLVEAAQQALYAASGTERGETRHAPAVWESSWRPGYGYGNYVPFTLVHSWHTQDVQAAQAASSSATTGYSSSGFSGGGGSRGF